MSDDEYKPSDPQLVQALDRAWIFRQAHKTLRELGFTSSDVMDVLAVAEFMAGVPRLSASTVEETESDDDSAE